MQKRPKELVRNERVEFGYNPRFTLWSWNRQVIGYVDKVTADNLYVAQERTISQNGRMYVPQKIRRYNISRISGLVNVLLPD
jgi:hypothetical protein